jgi:hypothetical protein
MTHSCFDNLLVCHFLDANKSVVFDVWDSRNSIDGNGEHLDLAEQSKQSASAGCVAVIPSFDIHFLLSEDAPLGAPPGEPASAQAALLSDFEFWPASQLAYNKKTRVVYRMKCCLRAFEAAGLASSPAAFLAFLLRRGQAPAAPRPVRGPDSALGIEAKSMVLERLYSLLEAKISVSQALSLLLPFVKEYSSTFLGHLEDPALRGENVSGKEHPGCNPSDIIKDEMVSTGSSGGNPLEQYVSFQLLKHDAVEALSGRGGGPRSLADTGQAATRPSLTTDYKDKNKPTSKFSSLINMSSARSRDGWLIVTQVELLCFVWMPLLLHPTCDIKYLARLLTLYQAELKGFTYGKLTPEPIVSLLLFKLLVSTKNEVEVARLMQTQFFSDSTELALECLSLADALESGTSDTDIVSTDVKARAQAGRMLHQSAMDVLWRLGEVVSLTRRLLHEGRVFEAVELCSKRKGMWRTGLSSNTISSDLFYSSLTQYIARLRVSELPYAEKAQRIAGALASVYEFLVDWDPSVLLEGADVSAYFTFYFTNNRKSLKALFIRLSGLFIHVSPDSPVPVRGFA